MQIDALQKSQITDFCLRNNIGLFIVFGSHAKGVTHAHSDIDIALVIENKNTEADKLQLIFELEDIFTNQVDLVLLRHSTDPLLLFEIFSTGKLIFESKSFMFEEYKLRAWKLYLDTQKIRAMRNQFVRNYLRKLADDF